MDQRSGQRFVRHVLAECGFRFVHETTAVTVLEHQLYPGVTVRMGTTRVIAERNGRECYRARISDFDLDDLLTSIADQSEPHEPSETERA